MVMNHYILLMSNIKQFKLHKVDEIDTEVHNELFDIDTYNVLRLAAGSTMYKDLPIPKQWNSIDRPHVALLEYTYDRVYSFLISQPSNDEKELWIRDLNTIQNDAVLEVKHTNSDYKYYRRHGQNWLKVAERHDQFFIDVYQRGNNPVVVPTLDDNWSAID